MNLKLIQKGQKNQYETKVSHVIQSWEWGEFREKLGLPLKRYGIYKNGRVDQAFQLTFHKIPFLPFSVGYLPKGPFPGKELAEALKKIGREEKCAFIKVEPDVQIPNTKYQVPSTFQKSPKPLFTKYNYVLDLTKSEEQLLKDMHQKTRYNIKVAQKNKVWVEERTDDEGFEIYLKLYFDTCKRQNYHGHNEKYHRLVWKTLKKANMARILITFYQLPSTSYPLPLTAWMLLNFKDTLYYPYGGSSEQHRNVMSSTLLAWEAIKLGKRLGLKKFDLWGALGPGAKKNDPWQGFTRFKSGLGGELVEYMGTYDLVLNYPVYFLFTLIDKAMWLKILLLKFIK